MTAANAVQTYDPGAAQKFSDCKVEIANLEKFSKYVQDEGRTWSAEDPFRRLKAETSKT